MFDRTKYKKDALSQLKNRWKIPCIETAISLLIFSVIGYVTKKRPENLYLLLISLGIGGVKVMVDSYIHLKLTRTNTSTAFSYNDILVPLGENWSKGVLGMLWFSLWTYLWALLFIIPGIVKSFSYSQMFFIMTENPKIGVKKAMNISKIITDGHKMNLFTMELSFFGWIILSLITSGIGFIWLFPYMNTAFSNAYTDLKMEAIRCGKITPADFSE